MTLSIAKPHFLTSELFCIFTIDRFSGLIFEISLFITSILVEKLE